MKTKPAIQTILTLGAVVLAVSSNGQTLLYDNGPVNGSNTAYAINQGIMVSDNFTLGADSTVANATIGTWIDPSGSLSSVQWSITTAAFGGTTLASGTATTTDTFLGISSGLYAGYYLYSDSFSITPTKLAAGTYWLQLGNAAAGSGFDAYWDANGGPSSAYQSEIGSVQSESFQLSGTITNAPEPSTIALAMLGGLSLLGFRRRK